MLFLFTLAFKFNQLVSCNVITTIKMFDKQIGGV